MKTVGNVAFLLTAGALASTLAVAGADEATKSRSDTKTQRERLLEICREEAASYTIDRDASGKERVELRNDPVYFWTNPLRGNGQDGAVFVWTCRGRAEVVGSIYSTSPAVGTRVLAHEFHSLATTVLDVTHRGYENDNEHEWKPTAPGITLVPTAGAPAPASSAARRLTQMRALSNEFSARSVDKKGQRWELRLLPQPLYRYDSTDPEVLDGAVFAYVTSAGTDPELFLVIEARRHAESEAAGASWQWQYALARFSDLNLLVSHKGNAVFSAEPIPWNAPRQDPQDRYRRFRNRQIPAVEELAP